ncbi:unnamed protein product [Prorocentrum cordatum]|uniref:Uncharacterized protein n=1 Tax=Prorocentrum cordatum TaxID=2364126 RepID=A0ABN9QJL4_9DINO|nr:unnamed protein product [Polarella glacialis]
MRSSGSMLRRLDFFNLPELGPPQISPIQAFSTASRVRAAPSTLASWRYVASRLDTVATETRSASHEPVELDEAPDTRLASGTRRRARDEIEVGRTRLQGHMFLPLVAREFKSSPLGAH